MAHDIFMRIENMESGEVITQNACNRESLGSAEKPGHEDECWVTALEHVVDIPMNPQTGQVTGNVRHKGIKVAKLIDRCSPLLAEQLTNPQALDVEIHYYRPGDDGDKEHYYTVHLEDAKIIGIETHSPDILDENNDARSPFEEIKVIYGKITWDHEICATTGAHDATIV